MASKLIIVESPTKAKTLKKFLGRSYTIEASMGHVIDLPKSKLGVDIENGFSPRYITIRGKGDVLKELRKKAKKADKVYLATDPDREGEAISWHLARTLSIPNIECRVTFHEITKTTVKEALKNPRTIDDKLVNAQQARRILDRLVGYQISPLLWKKVKKGLSAGRVQTVALRLICEREREILAFVPVEYWSFTGQFQTAKEQFAAKLHRIQGKKFTIDTEEKATELVKKLQEESFAVKKVKETKRRRNPPPPLITSTLQQEAIKQLGFTARKTMVLAQQLYEGIDLGKQGTTGLITYMRTDSVRVSPEAIKEARSIIKKKFGQEYCPKNARTFKQKGRSQDAHEAIRPTNPSLLPQDIKDSLNKDQYSLYRLIWNRYLASQMEGARFQAVTADIEGGPYLFRANGYRMTFPGFLALLGKGSVEEKLLPPLKEGEKASLKEIKKEQHFTQPPPRYTEGTLVQTLEEEGVGRPSTYAPIVATIQQRGYVLLESGRFKPTELGFIVNDLMVEFFPEITEVEFTAQMEERLDQIEDGKEDWKNLLQQFYADFSPKLKEAQEKMEDIEIEDEKTDIQCSKCGADMVVKFGRYGKFLACPRFPECRYTQPYMRVEDIDCFQCDKGKIVQRKSKKGRVFYACNQYPDCDYSSWKRPLPEKCPKCGTFLLQDKKKGNEKKVCANPDCGWEEEGLKNGKG